MFIVAVMGFLIVFVIPSGLIVTTQIILLVNSIVRLATAAGLLPWSIVFFIITLVLVIVGIITFIFALIFFIILTLFYILFLSFVNEIEIR
jgi:hypothetical protein